MKAVSCKGGNLQLVDLPDPKPGKGQVLINVLGCGICGSDLHARHHCDELADVMAEAGYDDCMRSDQEIVFGHEFCGEIVELGPGCRKSTATGTPVVALPILRGAQGVHPTGLSQFAPGAYAEQVVAEESLTIPVPNGLASNVATLTEPMAIGRHAVNRGEVKKKTVAVVIGCGPVGLAVISMLKADGVRTIVASDFSAGRRDLARACGATVVVDPTQESPFASSADHGHMTPFGAQELAVSAMEKIRRLRLPWWHVWRAVEALGLKPKSPVIFECVGVPGVIDTIVAGAPAFSRVVVVGVCMGADQIRPSMAIMKEVDLRFALGYSPLEFYDTLHMLAEGKVDPGPLVTGVVGLAGVENAFGALGDPETHAKILIDPKSTAAEPVCV